MAITGEPNCPRCGRSMVSGIEHLNCQPRHFGHYEQEVAAARLALVAYENKYGRTFFDLPCPQCLADGYEGCEDGCISLNARTALATPSAAAERVKALTKLADKVRHWVMAEDAWTAGDDDRGEAFTQMYIAERKVRAALAALDAATNRNPRTVEEVKGDG